MPAKMYDVTLTDENGKERKQDVMISNFSGTADEAKEHFQTERRRVGQNITVTSFVEKGSVNAGQLSRMGEQLAAGVAPDRPAV